MSDLCDFPEFVAALKWFDDAMSASDMRSHYLVPKYDTEGHEELPWELQAECYYRLQHYQSPKANQVLNRILTTSEVLLIDSMGQFNPITLEQLRNEGYCVSRIFGGPLNSWSLAQLAGRNFTLYFG